MTPISGTPRLTAIVPCAGAGARFGAPYPKELHCLAPGVTVVDRSFAPLLGLAETGSDIRVALVVDSDRHATISHIGQLADRLDIVAVFQPPSSHLAGTAAAVHRALPLCSGPVLIMMPDQYFDLAEDEDNPLERALGLLGEPADRPVVLAAAIDDPAELRVEGALSVVDGGDGHFVAAATEKPDDPRGFNAVWAAVLFPSPVVEDVVQLFDPGAPSPLIGAKVVHVNGYRHLTYPERARG